MDHIVCIFVVLVFAHFFVDWGFQTHAEAMAKSTLALVRAYHCLIYTAGVIVACAIVTWPRTFASVRSTIPNYPIICGILFFSHFFEDTYKPVIWWFKHIRRHPAFKTPLWARSNPAAYLKNDLITLEWALKESPLNYILLIAIDQIIHISFLWPVAYLLR